MSREMSSLALVIANLRMSLDHSQENYIRTSQGVDVYRQGAVDMVKLIKKLKISKESKKALLDHIQKTEDAYDEVY